MADRVLIAFHPAACTSPASMKPPDWSHNQINRKKHNA